ncbi:S-ribosylhomocysteinase LuxS [[Clostridium] methylpentosum DSM 5476]|jgi:S-ribosylhomocysteine lyase|uniref:S-ribosylhomocysteine lyase n=1 Tax=[Clostridium] methylpentosum DSM 5476 TaxID=537013 RepID=C0E976_9FIRM|nr:S-ribosylhomocysteinase LuxS [[Clostridium] methylpentosum DSM 5476]
MELKKIASFQVDHTKLDIGMYLSRMDGDIMTYDVRLVKPNGGTYLSSASMHTIEHLFATYARSTRESKHVIYVGPMGCRTGFYFITRGISHMQAIELVRESLTFVRDYEGEIPGATEVECGNYREHDLTAAKEDVVSIVNILQNYTPEQLVYKV